MALQFSYLSMSLPFYFTFREGRRLETSDVKATVVLASFHPSLPEWDFALQLRHRAFYMASIMKALEVCEGLSPDCGWYSDVASCM